jgi:hypothetical protein
VCRNTIFPQPELCLAKVPDVSAIFQAPFYFDRTLFEFASTTAISASIFASSRSTYQRAGLGLLNPLIYQNPGAFNDIATGEPHSMSNSHAESDVFSFVGFNHGCQELGLSGTIGWDPVGLVLPFSRILPHLLSLTSFRLQVSVRQAMQSCRKFPTSFSLRDNRQQFCNSWAVTEKSQVRKMICR